MWVENTADDPSRRRPDITKAKTMLGWEPKVGVTCTSCPPVLPHCLHTGTRERWMWLCYAEVGANGALLQLVMRGGPLCQCASTAGPAAAAAAGGAAADVRALLLLLLLLLLGPASLRQLFLATVAVPRIARCLHTRRGQPLRVLRRCRCALLQVPLQEGLLKMVDDFKKRLKIEEGTSYGQK